SARRIQQLVLACAVHRVVKRRAAPGVQCVNALGQQVKIVSPVLLEVRRRVKAFYESLVCLRPERRLQKGNRSLLLELKTSPDRSAGVDQNSHAERQVRLLGKAVNALRSPLVVEQRKIALVQILNEAPVLVRHGKDQVNLVDLLLNRVLVVTFFVVSL